MPRIRTVKPELFLDEDLGHLSGDHTRLFVGLLTCADREGRLDDRPKRLRAALFPYREVDVDRLLQDLDEVGKIQRYEIDGDRFIVVSKFKVHQRPHPKEPESIIPPPPSREKTRPAVEKHGEPRKDTAGFSSIPSSPVGREGKGREGDLGREGKGTEPAPPDPAPAVSDLQALWNEAAHPDLPRWQETSDKRRKAAKARLGDRPLSGWRSVIERISASSFCRGVNDRAWVASPDWLLQPDTAAKVLEGKYDDRVSWSRGPERNPYLDVGGRPREVRPCDYPDCTENAQWTVWGHSTCRGHHEHFMQQHEQLVAAGGAA